MKKQKKVNQPNQPSTKKNVNLFSEEPRHPRHEFLTSYIILHIEYIKFHFITILYLYPEYIQQANQKKNTKTVR